MDKGVSTLLSLESDPRTSWDLQISISCHPDLTSQVDLPTSKNVILIKASSLKLLTCVKVGVLP